MSEFVHLHLHSDYSILDGACPVKGVIECASGFGMKAVAVTDHGSMGGALEFYQALNKAGIKPIIGCEAYLSPTTRFDKDQNNPDIKGYHIVLLAEDFEGYQNLCRLVSKAELEGLYYKPRIDKELLSKLGKGIIGLSACLKGELAVEILRDNVKGAKKALQEYLDILGRKNFYIELMDHGIAEQRKVNRELVLLAREFDVPLVATNDVHYLRKEHAQSHDLLLCIQTHATENEPGRLRFTGDQFYFRSPAEMMSLFEEVPEACSNTLAVAERCNVAIPLNTDKNKVNHYPVYKLDSGTGLREYLRGICLAAMQERYGFDPRQEGIALDEAQKAILDRMDYEISVIDKSGYVSYFLIVWDFLKHAREQGIAVGPGRGSGAGSIVAYLTRITDIDPIRYSLLFERFLNPERVSPPDFDIDLCERRRYEVIEYVRRKYGAGNVAQIGTYGTLKAKAVIKDLARVTNRTYADSESITKLIPERVQDGSDTPKEVTIKIAMENSQELRDKIDKEPWVKSIIEHAKVLEQLKRQRTIHAAGVIIGDQPLDNLIPLGLGSGSEVITQYAAKYCEDLGFLKMDFLGLRTLTLIEDSLEIIRRIRNVSIDIERIPLDDKPTYDLLNRGDTVAVFQLESGGMQELCKKFGIRRMEDIIALIALYRPGPMQFINEFISRKTGHTSIEYDHPAMKSILAETYGIMLYQEQIMEVVQKVAGFTLGGADILRRIIGKKKAEDMDKQMVKFLEGCAANGVSERKARDIWEKIKKFAGYGFNKSHSAAYAFLAYRTAYLKANYPVEFMTAVLTSEINDSEKVSFLIQECRKMGIPILPPDINVSDINFTVDGRSIRFGLAAVKGVGSVAAEKVRDARRDGGPFKDMLDFCERAGAGVNSRMLENLCRAGAFDRFRLRRSQIIAVKDSVLSLAASKVKDKASGQGSLFEALGGGDDIDSYESVQIPDIPEFEEHEMLKDEKELLGFYVTGHPLGEHSELIRLYSTRPVSELASLGAGAGVKVGGIIESLECKPNKRNETFAVFRLEDLGGSIECIVFPKAYAKVKAVLEKESAVFIEASVDIPENGKAKLLVNDIIPLKEVTRKYTREIVIVMHEGSTSADMLGTTKDICTRHPGNSLLVFRVVSAEGENAFIESAKKFNVSVNEQFIGEIRSVLGENCIHLIADTSPPPTPRNNGGNGFHRKPWNNNQRNGD